MYNFLQVTKKKRGGESNSNTNKQSSVTKGARTTKNASSGKGASTSAKTNNFERLISTLQNALPDVSRYVHDILIW
jgi:hypothetical protein